LSSWERRHLAGIWAACAFNLKQAVENTEQKLLTQSGSVTNRENTSIVPPASASVKFCVFRGSTADLRFKFAGKMPALQ